SRANPEARAALHFRSSAPRTQGASPFRTSRVLRAREDRDRPRRRWRSPHRAQPAAWAAQEEPWAWQPAAWEAEAGAGLPRAESCPVAEARRGWAPSHGAERQER